MGPAESEGAGMSGERELVAVVREFINEVDAVGHERLSDPRAPEYWPDLLRVYQRARAVLAHYYTRKEKSCLTPTKSTRP